MSDKKKIAATGKDSAFESTLMASLSPNIPAGAEIPGPLSPDKKKSVDPGLVDDEDLEHLTIKGYGINLERTAIHRNISTPKLYEMALNYEKGTTISSTGALMVYSGQRTGRSPKDKRIVKESASEKDVWWGPINKPLSEKSFLINRERAIDFLNTRDRLYVIDAFAGWHKDFRLKVRVITSRAYHALFMSNMLVLPTKEELASFGTPEFTIYNSGEFPANRYTDGMTSDCSVSISFSRKEMVILGTQYAGEMKKGIFSVMHYYMPKRGCLSLHSSCNVGKEGDVTVFFGLSGTGKTTLSTDPHRKLVGDDEHVWYDDGIFNIEGGCYAKAIKLSKDSEPDIFGAIRFGSVLENVIYDPRTRVVDYDSDAITMNTRTSYPIQYIENSLIPCMAKHPTNILLLTCDAFGVLPPVAKLTPEQAMYYFISGYTAKVAGTEMGITEPVATFSACFGAAFLVWHPTVYAKLLAEKMKKHKTHAWLVNTGWSGGAYGVGKRMKLKYTRAVIDAIHDGSLAKASFVKDPVFGFEVPQTAAGVPDEILNPRDTWADKTSFDATAKKVASLFRDNFKDYAAHSELAKKIEAAGPKP